MLGSWEDAWERLGIDVCDVALASRSLTVDDLRAALLKLHRAARRRIFLTVPVGTGPIDPRVVRAAGLPYLPGPDYVYPLNLLRQLGVAARLEFISVTQARRFASVAEAVEGVSWMIADASPLELERLQRWVERELVAVDGALELRPPHSVTWAVLSWSKDDLPG